MEQDLVVVNRLVYFGAPQGYPSDLRTEVRAIVKTPWKTDLKKAKCTFSGLGIRGPTSGARPGGSVPLAGDSS